MLQAERTQLTSQTICEDQEGLLQTDCHSYH